MESVLLNACYSEHQAKAIAQHIAKGILDLVCRSTFGKALEGNQVYLMKKLGLILGNV
ncbi:hypothetical protein OGM63_20795 [Plectonema radiosum NIES-515]|uniref:CHAT domain-containing protein n=1 Tax=Plectonema radiosum NIES-515 TaxID=2986073 RepID=A0ABT3B3G3_9CYAN|nr:hypothetical protein [Plectonema radiosum]MCV3215915.1 hypothetical protein [Plectonema radiosum NIES-515]